MKTKLMIVLFNISIFANAQYSYEYQSATVTTLTGVSVDALQFKYWIYDDFDASEQASEDYEWTDGYNCRVIASSTKYYNCHGHAWHNVEGNMAQDKLRWINDIDYNGNPTYNVHKYYSSVYSNGKPSYKQETVNNKANLKVSYFPRDHSAITTSDPQKFISKWAWGPLVEHAPAQCPFYNNAQIKYYSTVFSISGPSSIICSSNTIPHTLNNADGISDSVVTWTCSSNLRVYPAGNLTGKSKVFKSNGNGSGWVRATMNGVALPQYNITWVGHPTGDRLTLGVPLQPPYTNVCRNTNTSIRAVNNLSDEAIQQITYYDWILFSWNSYIQGYTNNGNILRQEVRLRLDNNAPNFQIVSVIPGNACGTGSEVGEMFYAVSCGYYYTYPNPASTILNIEFDQEVLGQAQAMQQTTTSGKQIKQDKTFDIRLYDGQGNLLRRATTKGSKVEFNVSNLSNGIYYLHIYDGVNEKPEMQQIMVEH